ncbi:MAG: flagellar biosynthetic protein FliO [Gallionella sp.]|nr:flagellar biosynthetic protein FliO [Gallionella sp.]
MTQQKTEYIRQRAKVLSLLCHAIFPLRGAQGLCLLMPAFYPLSSAYAAETARPTYTPPPPAVSSGSIVQIIFSLLLVLAAIVLVAWLLKRMNMSQQGSVKLLKVLGAVPIGQRERIVLIEIKDTWLVVGVGPGQIRTLHSLQKMDDPATDLQPTEAQPSGSKFSSLLSSVLNNHRQKTIRK